MELILKELAWVVSFTERGRRWNEGPLKKRAWKKEDILGLSDIEEYDSDELPHEYGSEDDGILKDDFVTFKLPKRMEDYKWEVGTYFATRDEFKEEIRAYAIHSGRNLKFKKNERKKRG
ncbi:hypothetical protein KIW84_060969 [Lathyrus oleraceus]|uniref:Uncharacterized protein n=1 Tax=Pisum sativum TaxID=3888 RepID=A0A9D4W317_PEA|nr:hypothetical protein KIW84_060969 [Pisum sativum]